MRLHVRTEKNHKKMKIVIIGNGITGVTCARYIRKMSNHQITLISAETDHFFSRTALMYIYMGHMKYEHTKPYEDWFWEKNRIDLKRAYVEKINTDQKELLLSGGSKMSYDKLVIASGSKPNKFGWPGQDLDGVQGLYSYQDLELLEKNTATLPKRAVIVGGGLIGIEFAEMLHSRHIPVTLLVRESSFWNNVLPEGESALVNRHILEHGFDLRLGVNLGEIIDDGNGRAKGVTIKETGEKINCQLVGLTAGVSPSINFLKESNIELDRGVLVNLHQETNVPDVYAAGDCAQFHEPVAGRRPTEQVWYTGKIQGQVVAQNICGEKTTYDPGHWFNSAKFLDIEYQTYGWVFPKLKDNETNFYWEHPDGKKCLHFVWDATTEEFIGLNTFGIRLRHEIFDRFLRDKSTITHVLENLKAANFDPEFYKVHEADIITKFNQKTGKNITLKKQSGLQAVWNILKR